MPDSSHRLPPLLEAKLRYIARQYQRRWQLRGRLKFALAFIATLLLLIPGLSLAAEISLPFMAPFGLAALLLAGLWRHWLYLPRQKQIDAAQIALFIDAHYPELENLTISSVEFGRADYRADSDWMVAHILADARTRAIRIDLTALADPQPLRKLALGGTALSLAGFCLLALLLHHWDLERLRSGFFSTTAYQSANFAVQPGDIRLRRGDDLTVWVKDAPADQSGALRWRTEQGNWQSSALEPSGAEGVHYFQLRDLQADTRYQIQIGRQRSQTYLIDIWSPPATESIDLTYHYPAYLDLPARQIIDGGPITAPLGTAVEVEVAVDKALERATLELASGLSIALSPLDERRWGGRLELTRDDEYHIALLDFEGTASEPSLPHAIVAEEDEPPIIQIAWPRGDDEATPLEEIAFAFSVSDDYGLQDYGLQYEIAGRQVVRLSLSEAATPPTEAKGEYLLALEELDLAAGDLITWTAWAADHKPERPPYESLGDPYFLEIRPFQRLFRQAVSNRNGPTSAGAAGNGGGGADQKQIIIATWNLRRDADDLDADAFTQRRDTIVEAQQRVLETALENRPPNDRERSVAELSQEIKAALDLLGTAALPTPSPSLSQAMVHQQRAYRYLLQLEPRQREIVQGQGAAGSGGRGSARRRELDALETTRRRDFSEQASTLQEQLAATRQARSDIEELARRQEFINQDIARLISEMEDMEEEERQEAWRQLEKLRQEQRRNLNALDEVGGRIAGGELDARQARRSRRQLDRARRQMQRSADDLAAERPQEARTAGRRALDALRQVGQDLDHLSRSAAARRLAQLGQQLDSLRARQADHAAEIRARREKSNPVQSLGAARQRTEEIIREQEETAAAFKEFMTGAGELADKAATSQGLMARKLGDWLRRTSRRGIYENLLDGVQYLHYGVWDTASELEEEITADLAQAAAGLDSVAAYLVEDDLDAREKALEQLQTLMEAGQDRELDADGERRDAERRGAAADSAADNWGPRTPEERRRFAARGYRDWIETIRNTEELLPEDSSVGAGLAGIREDLGGLGRRYERDKTPPHYDLIFERAVKPLTLAAEKLQREIGRQRGAYEMPPAAGEIPAPYRERVAEYFKALSELEID